MRRFALVTAIVLGAASLAAQLRVQPVAEHPDEVTLRLLLRKLASSGTFMQTTAHPDDEDNGLLAMMGHGRGMRSVLVTATRGDGGQNEIGPELFEALSVLRTEELMAAHRVDGAEQHFTRAVDFGYSFSVEESLRLWGHQEILGDFVRLIRAVRPDVIAGFICDGDGGGQHHQASTVLTREAFRAAAEASRYPEQIDEGLRPWQALRLFCTDRSSFTQVPRGQATLVTIPNSFEPLLGRGYNDLGIEARSMHKCQGTSQLLPLPGQSFSRVYRLEQSRVPFAGAPNDLFAGIDTSLQGLARFAGAQPSAALVDALGTIANAVVSAERAVRERGLQAASPPLAAGLGRVRQLRANLVSMPFDDTTRFEIDFRLRQKEEQFQRALAVSQGLRLEVLASDGLVIEGQPITLNAMGINNGAADVEVNGISFTGFAGTAAPCHTTVKPSAGFTCEAAMQVADLPLTTPYWRSREDAARYDFEPAGAFGAPFAPTPFRAVFSMTIAGARVELARDVEFRYDNIVAGEKYMNVHVVPRLAVSIAPEIVVIPSDVALRGENGNGSTRRIEVTIVNHDHGAQRGEVELQAPAGWRADPARAAVAFTREDESATVKFDVTPPSGTAAGEYSLAAAAYRAAEPRIPLTHGYQVIEYPHIHRRHLVKEARTRLKVIDVTVAADLDVGYVMGVGDQVPQAIEQLGARVHLINTDELAAGDLARYDVIVTGVRAYERRPDLRAHNHRLLEYARGGGTVIVQYNKFEFNQAQYGPYPAKVSANRVTDENAPVEILVSDHPVFNTPNRIGAEAWSGWVQERGLYFLGDRDSRYVDLVRLADPFEYNPGPKTGALVEAEVGKGRWVYVGLGLWRQLPAGTDGAYRLLANLLTLGRAR